MHMNGQIAELPNGRVAASQLLTNSHTLCDLLCIDIGVERFALPLSIVEEMLDGCSVELTTGFSNHNRHMVGVIRVRHELLPVYEGANVFNVHRSGAEPMALVLQGKEKLIVLLVDGAEAAPQVDLGTVRTPARLMAIDRVLDGVLQVNGRWVGLVNTAALVEALERDNSYLSDEVGHGS